MAVSQSLPYREISGDTGRVFRVGEEPLQSYWGDPGPT